MTTFLEGLLHTAVQLVEEDTCLDHGKLDLVIRMVVLLVLLDVLGTWRVLRLTVQSQLGANEGEWQSHKQESACETFIVVVEGCDRN